jgi:hypothetical protein
MPHNGSMEDKRQAWRIASWQVAAVALGIFVAVISLGYGSKLGWIGVAKDPNYKTLWDWLDLLVVPLALAGVAPFMARFPTSSRPFREDLGVSASGYASDYAARIGDPPGEVVANERVGRVVVVGYTAGDLDGDGVRASGSGYREDREVCDRRRTSDYFAPE